MHSYEDNSENKLSNEGNNNSKQDTKLLFSTKIEKNNEIKYEKKDIKNKTYNHWFNANNYYGKGSNKKILDIVNEISFCLIIIDEM